MEKREHRSEQSPGEAEQLLREKMLYLEKLYTNYGEKGKEHVGIDAELKEPVGVFLAMGMHTEASCWGHPERRDDPNALQAEKNFLPYIDFSGYEPTDGQDENGRAVGYTDGQVDAACERMRIDAGKLNALLDEFYASKEGERMIILNYIDDLPGARLVTAHKDELEEASREAQDEAIKNARRDWSGFLQLAKTNYLKSDI